MVLNPFGTLTLRAVELLNSALKKLGVDATLSREHVKKAPSGMGDLAFPAFPLAKTLGKDPGELAAGIAARAGELLGGDELFSDVQAVRGYVNIFVNVRAYGKVVYDSVRELGDRYGWVPAEKPERIIVEHTSANPIHPLHVGHLRNCLLGDALARLLRARGHKVSRHFYIDDVGLQVAYAAYGYRFVKDAEASGKPDHFIGRVYSITATLVELESLKKRIREAEERGDEAERSRLVRKQDELAWTANELRSRDERLFDAILEGIRRDEDPEAEVQRINNAYERGEEWAVRMVRDVVEKCLEGFRETLGRLGVEFDSWDWESELTVWNRAAHEVVEKLVRSGFVYEKGGALVFAADKLAGSEELRRELGIPPGFEVYPLTLTRSDGTTLYPTRDIAYSLWKLGRAERVINVIGVQQTLAQTQLRLALYLIGGAELAKRLIHYSYESVRLPGIKMSSRRGRFVTADELVEEAVERAREETLKRGLAGGKDVDEIAEKVGIGAIKYTFLSVSPSKVITFKWERVLDFNQNSGPFVQYAYVRARSILRKADCKPELHPEALGEEEKPLIMMVGEFPEVVSLAADSLRVDLLAQFLNDLAIAFNKYYDTTPVLRAPEGMRETRLAVVEAVATTLKNGLALMGIEVPERM